MLRHFNGTEERYLTTQHERDQETGLDYRGARYYDADVARFLSLDPLASGFPEWSDYNYVMGNPVRLIDTDGKAPTDIVINGINGSSRTLVTDKYDLTLNVNHDFGGNEKIGINTYAYGNEIGISGDYDFQDGFGATGGIYQTDLIFKGGEYDNYVYSYINAETGGGVGMTNKSNWSVGLNGNSVIGFGSEPDLSPSSVEGSYFHVAASFDVNAKYQIGLTAQLSFSETWTFLSLGGTAGLDSNKGGANGSIKYGPGLTTMINEEIPTAERSFSDIFINASLHTLSIITDYFID